MYCLCEDESVIGRAFYVMEFVPGRVLWDQSLPGMSTLNARAIYDEMNRVIAALHTVEVRRAAALRGFGKPGNYFERQIGRWSKQYQASVTQPIPEMDQLIAWLPAHIPAKARDESHGQHRARRLPPRQPDVSPDRAAHARRARLGTVHPRPPAGRLHLPLHGLAHPAGLVPRHRRAGLAALGIPTEGEYIRLYCDRTGTTPAALKADWNFYLAYNMFRMAAILQGIVKRVEAGTASSAQAIDRAPAARPMAELALEVRPESLTLIYHATGDRHGFRLQPQSQGHAGTACWSSWTNTSTRTSTLLTRDRRSQPCEGQALGCRRPSSRS